MKAKTVFFCTECGNETLKWQGQCPACKTWNTIVEHEAAPQRRGTASKSISKLEDRKKPVPITQITAESQEIRFETGLGELDRVLGGGAVIGSLVLVGGAPGIGKSTLLLQICRELARNFTVLYVSGEESERQISMRAHRLGVSGERLLVLGETNLDKIIDAVETSSPDILIVDSIQTLFNSELTSAPGSVGQVKDCTMALMQLAKGKGTTIFVIGHINKDGAIAGPKVLEHMVDCVLYFEGEGSHNYRILRAAKNRFGSTNEIGMFEMRNEGLCEVLDPSESLLSGKPKNTPGTCVTCVMEGSRPLLAEIQALLAKTSFNVPRRTSNGIDYNRAMLLLAVLEKRGGFMIGGCDAYINVIGGLNLSEPTADLATVLAVSSSFVDRPVPDDLAAIGEVGLTGEIRSVNNVEKRLVEIRRHGFQKCILPVQNREDFKVPTGLTLIQVKNIREAIEKVLGNSRKAKDTD